MVSTNFINECKNRANANRLGQIVVEGADSPITQSDNLQSFSIDSGCYVDGNIIGSIYVKKLTGNFIAVPDNIDLINKTIHPSVGVKYADLSNEYIGLGKYTIERPNNEETAKMTQITAYDDLVNKIDDKYVCQIDYSQGNISVGDIYIDVCNQLGLIPKTTTFINSDIPVSNNPFTNGEKNRIVLQTVAKVACSFVTIDDETNEIDLSWLSENEEPDYTFEKSDYATLEGGQIQYGPINSVTIKNSQIDDENVTKKDNESITTNGEHSVIISEDYILYNADLREQAITSIYERLNGLKYIDSKLVTYYGKPFLKIGAKIRIMLTDSKFIDTYNLKHNFTYDGTFTSVIESPALTEQEIKTKQDIGLQETLKNTQITVNKQEQTITSLVEEVDTYDSKITKIEQDIDSIQQEVENNIDLVRELNDYYQVETENAEKYEPLGFKTYGNQESGNNLIPDENVCPRSNLCPLSNFLYKWGEL